MMLIPYRLETTFTRIPYTNAVLIIITSLIFFLPSQVLSIDDIESFVLRDWDLAGLLGCNFLHGGFFHLLGNMLFLWVFGNAVCAAVGNGAYIFVYLFLGMFSGTVHLIADGNPAIGASGAINGIVGMTLVLFPRNTLHNWYWIFYWAGTFTVKTYWMIILWFIFDIIGSMGSPDGIAHWMHIGGLTGGIILAFVVLKFNLMETYHHTILDIFAGRSEEENLKRTLSLEQQVGFVSDAVPVEVETSDMLPQGQIYVPSSSDTPSAAPLLQASVPSPAPVPLPAVPDIQLKKCVGSGTSITLYIVNKGAAMNSLTLRTPQGVTAQMSPSKAIRGGETGSIRFSTVDTVIDSIEFIIAYKNSGAEQHKIRFRCIPAESKLEVISSTQKP